MAVTTYGKDFGSDSMMDSSSISNGVPQVSVAEHGILVEGMRQTFLSLGTFDVKETASRTPNKTTFICKSNDSFPMVHKTFGIALRSLMAQYGREAMLKLFASLHLPYDDGDLSFFYTELSDIFILTPKALEMYRKCNPEGNESAFVAKMGFYQEFFQEVADFMDAK